MSSSETMSQPSNGRIALVIGNADYEHTRRLNNAEADASAIAEALAEAGFKSHKKGRDGRFEELTPFNNVKLIRMQRLLAEFGEVANQAEMAIIYYSGHGIEIDFRNYLIPIDAQIPHVSHVPHETVRLADVIGTTFGAAVVKLVILDACRDNPFLERMKGIDLGKTTKTKPGLEPQFLNGAWTFYAASEGQMALEGPEDGLSPFAESLYQRLQERDRELFRIMGKVTDDVRLATQNRQEPKFYGSPPSDEIYLYPRGSTSAGEPAPATPTPRPKPRRPRGLRQYRGAIIVIAVVLGASFGSVGIYFYETSQPKPAVMLPPRVPPGLRALRLDAINERTALDRTFSGNFTESYVDPVSKKLHVRKADTKHPGAEGPGEFRSAFAFNISLIPRSAAIDSAYLSVEVSEINDMEHISVDVYGFVDHADLATQTEAFMGGA
jgi:Caspase domain